METIKRKMPLIALIMGILVAAFGLVGHSKLGTVAAVVDGTDPATTPVSTTSDYFDFKGPKAYFVLTIIFGLMLAVAGVIGMI